MDIELTKEELGFIHIVTGIEAICKIPNTYKENVWSPVLRVALIECWSVNMRLMIEFFDIGGGKKANKDFSYNLYDYNRLSGSYRKNDSELIKLKDMISKFVVHFGLARIDESNAKYNDFEVANIGHYSSLILPEIKSFIEHMIKNYPKAYNMNRTLIQESLDSIK